MILKTLLAFLVPTTVEKFLREKHADYPGKCSPATEKGRLLFFLPIPNPVDYHLTWGKFSSGKQV